MKDMKDMKDMRDMKVSITKRRSSSLLVRIMTMKGRDVSNSTPFLATTFPLHLQRRRTDKDGRWLRFQSLQSSFHKDNRRTTIAVVESSICDSLSAPLSTEK